MTDAASVRRPHTLLILMLAAMSLVSGCDISIGGPHYVPASSSVDPFASVRAKAEQYYQSGLDEERKGNWKKALQDFQQASAWDHDGRQDIADALSRAQAQIDWQTYQQVGSSANAQHSDAQPQQSSTPSTPAATVTAPANSTTHSSMKAFKSQAFPYSISFPSNWVEKSGGTPDQPTDTFAGTSENEATALVMVAVTKAEFGITLDELYVGTVQSLKAQGINNVQIIDRRQVGGQPSYTLSYLDDTGTGKVSVRHSIFVTPGKVWQIMLLASPSVTASLDEIFNSMLDSFTFQASAFPVQ